MGKKLKIEEVAVKLGVSVKTINNWYWFKRTNPEVEEVKLLPEYIQEGARQTRFWDEDDLDKFVQFKDSVKHGRSGFMGSVTQKYIRTRKEREANETEN